MQQLHALSLFSGIGGIDIAAEMAGIKIEALCEIEPFPTMILQKRYPNTPIIHDIREIKGEDYASTVNFIYGGFPCQDLSLAGKRAGLEGERSKLWYEMQRLISECRPNWVLAENVRGAIYKALDSVQAGLADEGYRVWTFVLPAAAFGAPHKRERMFIVGVKNDIAELLEKKLRQLMSGSSENSKTDLSLSIEQFGAQDLLSLWPTLTVCGNYNKSGLSKNSENGLPTAVKACETIRQKVEPQGDCSLKGKTLNPDWCEQLMGFPEGWTNPNVDVPAPWRGWPAVMKKRLWMTPKAGICGMTARTKGRPLEKSTHLSAQVYCVEKARLWPTLLNSDAIGVVGGHSSLRTETHGENAFCQQYDYEFPRITPAKNDKYRASRIKALGNAVVPAQIFPLMKAIVTLNSLV